MLHGRVPRLLQSVCINFIVSHSLGQIKFVTAVDTKHTFHAENIELIKTVSILKVHKTRNLYSGVRLIFETRFKVEFLSYFVRRELSLFESRIPCLGFKHRRSGYSHMF